MSLTDRLAEPPPSAIPVKCLMCKALEMMDEGEAEQVQEEIHGHRWTDPALLGVLHEEGYDFVTLSSVKNHRQTRHA